MSTPIISIKGVGKRFILGDGNAHDTLRDHLTAGVRRLFGGAKKKASEEYWALRDVSFDVNEGEVVGIIGHNGAGKSTLLKILSQISEPTEGEIRVRGRIASLLEVGTGFHPELSGRENIYLNGAILGMTRAEIRSKFDEIVAFAEVEKFLDTPVKRYSSGMYVRLAFAVAAHLEPEILVVDEVLAVGDVAFQKKCLGKMGEVANQGRTVIFVSHQMSAVSALCQRAVYLNHGRVHGVGQVKRIIEQYLSEVISSKIGIFNRPQAKDSSEVVITDLQVDGLHIHEKRNILSGEGLRITLRYLARNANMPIRFLISIYDSQRSRVLGLDSAVDNTLPVTWPISGALTLEFPADFSLGPDRYHVNCAALIQTDFVDFIADALIFDVNEGDFFGNGRKPFSAGAVLIKNKWHLQAG